MKKSNICIINISDVGILRQDFAREKKRSKQD
jgi:hypothetical protein